jgi:hypothetical protein
MESFFCGCSRPFKVPQAKLKKRDTVERGGDSLRFITCPSLAERVVRLG